MKSLQEALDHIAIYAERDTRHNDLMLVMAEDVITIQELNVTLPSEQKDTHIPFALAAELRDYVQSGERPSPFILAVLRNDLTKSVVEANESELFYLKAVMEFLFAFMPARSWGDPDRVDSWLAGTGMPGYWAKYDSLPF